MATVRCKSCGNLVAFRGQSTTCPACEKPISVSDLANGISPGESADTTLGPAEPTLVAEYGRGTEIGVDESPAKSPLLALVIAALILMLLVGVALTAVWLVLHRTPSAPPVVPFSATPSPPFPPAATAPAVPTPAPTPPPATEPTPTPTPPPATTRAATTEPTWLPIRPQAPTADFRGAVTEARLEAAIRKAVDYLLDQFDGAALKDIPDTEERGSGRNALAVYALLAAGKDLQDQRLDIRTSSMAARVDRVKSTSPVGSWETYCRSLRMQCLAYANRPADRGTIEADLRWMLKANSQGAFTYREASADNAREGLGGGWWDKSCTQYGLLGVWAASMAGVDVPSKFWGDTQYLWLLSQDTRSGGWSYKNGNDPRISMTASGVNALVVASDLLGTNTFNNKPRDYVAERAAIQRGLDYLGRENRIANFSETSYGYSAYAIERVGLATGYKYIGEVDWYKTIAAELLRDQSPNGSWSGRNETDTPTTEASFCLLFLVRGRPPVMMAKLKYDSPPTISSTGVATPTAAWQKFPRDLANLTTYATQKTERPLNWQVVDLKHTWREWLDAPVLMISGNAPIELRDEDIENFRQYIRNGGLIFTHADGGSESFTRFVEGLAAKLVDNGKLAPLPPDHPIHSMVIRPNPAPPLQGMTNGNRLVLVHSPTELTNRWQRRVPPGSQQNLEEGLNVFVYAAGRGVGRNRTDSAVLPEPVDLPVGSLTIARIKGETPGNWDIEPAAWPRAARHFELATRIHADIKEIPATALFNPLDIPLAVITVPESGVSLTKEEVTILRRWINAGGTLMVDPVGGGNGAVTSANSLVQSVLGPAAKQARLSATDVLLSGNGFGRFSVDLKKTSVTDFTLGTKGGRLPAPYITRLGKGFVINSDLDITTGLLDCNVWGISGYTPAWSMGFTRNLLLTIAAGTTNQAGPDPVEPDAK